MFSWNLLHNISEHVETADKNSDVSVFDYPQLDVFYASNTFGIPVRWIHLISSNVQEFDQEARVFHKTSHIGMQKTSMY